MTLQDYIKLAESATDGPWNTRGPEGRLFVEAPEPEERNFGYAIEVMGDDDNGYDTRDQDAQFIAASRTLGPAMAKALIEAEEALKASMLTMKNHQIHAPVTLSLQKKALSQIQALNGGE